MIERIEVDNTSLAALVTALRAESDGKKLTRDLVVQLEAIAEPIAMEARLAILSMDSSRATTRGVGLRATVASRVVVRVRLGSKRHPGVAIRALSTGMPRGFTEAPKRLNSKRGWRHPLFGNRDSWWHQIGQPDWFDGTMARHRTRARRAAQRAIDNVARRISARTRG